jgi:hypothetical protein
VTGSCKDIDRHDPMDGMKPENLGGLGREPMEARNGYRCIGFDRYRQPKNDEQRVFNMEDARVL